MQRHEFLSHLLGAGAALGAGFYGCASSPSPASRTDAREARPRARIRAICFDLFTIFDPRSVVQAASAIVPEQAAALCEAWRSRQFEYSWLRVAAGQYVDFREITRDALEFAARSLRLRLSSRDLETLVEAYSRLAPWPDTRATLMSFQQSGLLLAPLSNYSPAMLERLIGNAGLRDVFARQISTDVARTFKPDPRAYALGVSALGLRREQIAFAAFGGWDAAGARWFGYPTFWVNRLGVPREELTPAPDGTGPTLAELATFVRQWH